MIVAFLYVSVVVFEAVSVIVAFLYVAVVVFGAVSVIVAFLSQELGGSLSQVQGRLRSEHASSVRARSHLYIEIHQLPLSAFNFHELLL